MYILGIETSCDETSVAIIENNRVLVNLVSSQMFHKLYGGVVPELSSRAHLEQLFPLIRESLKTAGLQIEDIDIIAATAGPGLIGALMVGYNSGKTIAHSLGKQFFPVNHIEGHMFSGFIGRENISYPVLNLTVSGGHTILSVLNSPTSINILGSTLDDAAGEAFDKVAKLTGMGYPGGPAIQNYASKGNEGKISFPVASLKSKYDFSFSGLKTAVLRYIQANYKNGELPGEDEKSDIALAFQNSAINSLINPVKFALKNHKFRSLSLNGGVAANKKLRESFKNIAEKNSLELLIPDFEYCGDNAAMIAIRAKLLNDSGVKINYLKYEPFPSFRSEFLENNM
ncbi:MAG: tRNA (adenosine(37)-N6)-threonylcarbamoyltransferase complex transferase subunit TsaD [Ignavibacteriaceae bacterium]|nr:tRNA (adenosine(37)-N6)-threonylcarbamoyltransferase complex transferase subunit TsaD [Ignavibacteriaceae bacterium]